MVLVYGQGNGTCGKQPLSVCHLYIALKWFLKYVTQTLELGFGCELVSPSCCQSRQACWLWMGSPPASGLTTFRLGLEYKGVLNWVFYVHVILLYNANLLKN